jgi:hypothetical protein
MSKHFFTGQLGEFPIECGWDNPNCLGGYTTILGARDAREEPARSRWGYPDVTPFQVPTTGGIPATGVEPGPMPPAQPTTTSSGTTPPNSTVRPTVIQTPGVSGQVPTSSAVLIGAGVIAVVAILVMSGKKS